jgi:hypothetical protein
MIFLERLWQDLRYGVRMLVGSPGFTIVAVLSLAIGIGANCAIFSFADALVLRPLPVPRPGEVYTVGSTTALRRLAPAPSSLLIRITWTSVNAATASTASPRLRR